MNGARLYAALVTFFAAAIVVAVAILGIWQLIDAPGIVQAIAGAAAGAGVIAAIVVYVTCRPPA